MELVLLDKVNPWGRYLKIRPYDSRRSVPEIYVSHTWLARSIRVGSYLVKSLFKHLVSLLLPNVPLPLGGKLSQELLNRRADDISTCPGVESFFFSLVLIFSGLSTHV